MLYLGIDQHRKQLTINLRQEDGAIIQRRQVGTRWADVRAFFAQLQQQAHEHGGWLVILEVCGFNDWLLEMLHEYGARDIVLLHPDSRQRRKTDRRDANKLGELLWINRQRLLTGQPVQGLRRVVIPSAADQLDRRLTTLRWRLGREQTRVLNRIRHLLLRHNLDQHCPTKGLKTLKAWRWLKELSLDELDRLELDHLLERWPLLQTQLTALEAKLKQRQAANPNAVLLASLPGGGAFTSLALACRVGAVERLPRPVSLPNYWGLTPACRNSGAATQRLGSITKEGSALARYLLGQMVIKVLKEDDRLRQWYKGIRRRRGSKIARVAVMRRLATVIWHMLKKRQPYRAGGVKPAAAADMGA